MKANELRIGNYLEQGTVSILGYYNKELVCYCSKNENVENCVLYPEKDLIPVPLTEEWMLKFGFEKKETTHKIRRTYVDSTTVTITSFYDDSTGLTLEQEAEKMYFYWNNTGLTIDPHLDYVHELQNLYFALTGDELEIIENEQSGESSQ